jgi:hypothetical protein
MQQFQFEQLQLQAIPFHCRNARVGGEVSALASKNFAHP